jgi:uncharacterized cupredoxin-like copper-binding protein
MRAQTIVALGAVALAAGGASAQAALQPQQARVVQASSLIKSVNVTATEFKYVLSTKTAKRGVVIFRIKNSGKLGHDFSINGRKTKVISPGKSGTLRIVFLRKGAYPYKCTVPGHAAAGMKGVFTIS